MKFLSVFFITIGFAHSLSGQSLHNYVKVYKAQKAISGDLTIYEGKDSVAVTIVYYDGLGREIQTIARQQSPLAKDIVTFSTYDRYGQKNKSYLPYVANQSNGARVVDPLSDQRAFYTGLFGINDGNFALSESVIERSELSRVIEQAAPGYDWRVASGHTVKKQFRSNVVLDSILKINYDVMTGISIASGSGAFYAENLLRCIKTIDEGGNDVLEFLDYEGRTVCKKVKASPVAYAYTYYIYDVFGNLVVVIPPEGIKQLRSLN